MVWASVEWDAVGGCGVGVWGRGSGGVDSEEGEGGEGEGEDEEGVGERVLRGCRRSIDMALMILQHIDGVHSKATWTIEVGDLRK